MSERDVPDQVDPSPEHATRGSVGSEPAERLAGLGAQARLEVGSVDDPAEREADEIARRVISVLQRPVDDDARVQPGCRGDGLARSIIRRRAPVGAAGGPVDGELEARIRSSTGAPLADDTRGSMERAFGTDFGDVRIHRGREPDAISRSLSAQAFTTGSDIFMSASAPDPDAAAGRELLAHELTHVVQQRHESAEGRRRIRRAVGFEFEDQTWSVFMLQPGRSLRKPARWKLTKGHVAPPGSEKTEEEEAAEEFTGRNIWAAPEGDTSSHINSLLGKFNLQTAPKKGTLHAGTGYKIEPDGPYSDFQKLTNRMDLEIVTKPFAESEEGLAELDAAFEDLRGVFDRLDRGAIGEWKGGDPDYDRLVGPEDHGFSTAGIYLYGGTPGGSFKPQVTAGIELSKLPDMMRTIGVGDETAAESEERAPIRELVYGQGDDPDRLAASSTTRIVGLAPSLAAATVADLIADDVIDDDDAGKAELIGFLSLAIVYMTTLAVTSRDGIKVHLPLLSRFSFADMWDQVPATTRGAVAGSFGEFATALDPHLKVGLAEFLERKYPNPGYAKLVADRSTDGLAGPMIRAHLPDGAELAAGLGSFSRRDWLAGIMAGNDLLKPGDLVAHLAASDDAADRAVAADYGKSAAIFLRGHANAKNVEDVEGDDLGSLALLENRNITHGPINLDQAHQLAMTYLGWLLRLRAAE